MRRSLSSAFAVAVALGVVAVPGLAVTCYEIVDRTDTVTFRGIQTPVDLSDAGARARDAMRNRGELLVFFDAERCVLIGPSSSFGGRALTADEIVAQFKGFATPKYAGVPAPMPSGGALVPATTGNPPP